ncbi:MAG TPA: DMT family transporter, partial [Candidatus Binatia bacterium]|nr:DMT family transporter [Candidatus Binatia bacterium]
FRPALRGVRRLVVPAACYAACLTTFVVATKWTTAANAIFLQYSGVVWVLLFSPRVVGEAVGARDAAAVAAALVGMALFFAGRLDTGGRAGDLVALLSGLFFAGLILFLRRERGDGGVAAATWGNVLAAAVLLPFVADVAVTPRSWAILALLGTVQIAAAYVLFVEGIRRLPAAQASLVGMLEPVANPLWVFLFLGEAPSPLAVVGGAIVLGAVAWRTRPGRAGESTAIPAPD